MGRCRLSWCRRTDEETEVIGEATLRAPGWVTRQGLQGQTGAALRHPLHCPIHFWTKQLPPFPLTAPRSDVPNTYEQLESHKCQEWKGHTGKQEDLLGQGSHGGLCLSRMNAVTQPWTPVCALTPFPSSAVTPPLSPYSSVLLQHCELTLQDIRRLEKR